MPLVDAYFGQKVSSRAGVIAGIRNACMEFIPAALNSPMAPLGPGGISFFPHAMQSVAHMGADVELKVVARDVEDRCADLNERAEQIRMWLKGCYPDYSFSVSVILVKMGWASSSPEPEPHQDMSMAAAKKRWEKSLDWHS